MHLLTSTHKNYPAGYLAIYDLRRNDEHIAPTFISALVTLSFYR